MLRDRNITRSTVLADETCHHRCRVRHDAVVGPRTRRRPARHEISSRTVALALSRTGEHIERGPPRVRYDKACVRVMRPGVLGLLFKRHHKQQRRPSPPRPAPAGHPRDWPCGRHNRWIALQINSFGLSWLRSRDLRCRADRSTYARPRGFQPASGHRRPPRRRPQSPDPWWARRLRSLTDRDRFQGMSWPGWP